MSKEKIYVVTEDENGTFIRTETISEEELAMLEAVGEPMDDSMKDEVQKELETGPEGPEE